MEPARYRTATRAIAAAIAIAGSGGLGGAAGAADSAVVLMYHRFGESAYPSTSISLAQFEAHLQELASGPYRVMPLGEIVAAIRAGRPLPDRAIGLSIDDAYLSLWTEAWPRLRARGFPFTLFVATQSVDKGVRGYMSWDQIRELKAAGVTIGSQTETHPHMPLESEAANRAEIEASNTRFKAELGAAPDLFAYPYGEASLASRAVVASRFAAAFGQHSGVVDGLDDPYYLPRFAFNESYGDLARFKLAANALPIKLTDLAPADPTPGAPNPPLIGFTVVEPKEGLDRMSCYASHEGRVRLERLGDVRIEARLATPLPVGRTRLNCTMPAADGRWRWFGRQFYVKP